MPGAVNPGAKYPGGGENRPHGRKVEKTGSPKGGKEMKLFTIRNGETSEGARVDSFTLKGAGVTIPAILIGEEGRGRKLGVLPVQLLPSSYKEWQEKVRYINFAEVGTTKAGKPKLLQTKQTQMHSKSDLCFRTK